MIILYWSEKISCNWTYLLPNKSSTHTVKNYFLPMTVYRFGVDPQWNLWPHVKAKNESFLNSYVLIKREQELYESWEARVCMRVVLFFLVENTLPIVQDDEFIPTFHQDAAQLEGWTWPQLGAAVQFAWGLTLRMCSPCFETITWVVFERHLLMPQEYLERFKALMTNGGNGSLVRLASNNREVKPLNSRTVLKTFSSEYNASFVKCY